MKPKPSISSKCLFEKPYIVNDDNEEIEVDPEIPATNNTVENYYRTTLPRSQKRIFRTLKGLKRRIKEQQIRWTHRIVLKQNTPINKNTTYN